MTSTLCTLLLLGAAPTIHTVTASPEGLSVNGYFVETAHGLIAIDSALTVSDGQTLRKRADALHKPVLAVLLTHGHPDHYNGVAALLDGASSPVPVYATAAVSAVIRDFDAAKERQWKPVFKDQWPATRVFPTTEVKDGQRVTIDAVTFVVHDLGAGESHADSYWVLEGPPRVAFIGDVVLSGSHAYTNDGHTRQWLSTLARLQRELAGTKQLYPGHGPAGDVRLLAWQAGYLTAYRSAVESLRGGQATLTDAAKQALEAKLKAAYPKEGNVFMITLGADTVAAELAAEQRR